jgi:PAS domain S-box-containing protein
VDSEPFQCQAILDSISDGVFTVGPDWKVTSFNRAAEEITGISGKEALGRLCSEVFRSSLCGADCPLKKTVASGRPVIGRSCYIVRGDGEKIPVSISTAALKNSRGEVIGGAETFRDLREIETLRRELTGRFTIGDLVTRSPAMNRVFELIPVVAATRTTVLIGGETGTGKEVTARAIHSESPWKEEPFVAVNCSALPEPLLESELFGYCKGAFTGADRDKPGRFAQAGNGTLFLDEIGEMPPAVQVKLLRVLQEKVFEPLGSVKPEKSGARIIAATHRDLDELVRQGKFREDLYYRINVVRIDLPPLRDRKEDLPLLAAHFVERFNLQQQRKIGGFSHEALSLLMAWRWPGNIRELQNVTERAFVLCPGPVIGLEYLPEELIGRRTDGNGTLAGLRRSSEEQLLRDALERCGGSRTRAAKELGINRATLYRKMVRYGLMEYPGSVSE